MRSGRRSKDGEAVRDEEERMWSVVTPSSHLADSLSIPLFFHSPTLLSAILSSSFPPTLLLPISSSPLYPFLVHSSLKLLLDIHLHHRGKG